MMQNGACQVQIRFSAPFGYDAQAAGIVLGYRSPEQHYVFAELGAARSAYSVGEYVFVAGRPRAFVVMQFAEPYDTFYKEVIQSQADAAGFDVIRIDEKAGPGVIFQDIQREIEQAEVIIAEITPANPNVFYEVGYAHALHKPTILLVQRGAQLPFDIRSFRVVFYNDSIGGKVEVERDLRKHLDAIAGK